MRSLTNFPHFHIALENADWYDNILGISADQTRSIALISGMAVLALAVIARPLLFASLAIGFYTGYPSSVCISLLAFASYVVVVGSSHLGSAWATEKRSAEGVNH